MKCSRAATPKSGRQGLEGESEGLGARCQSERANAETALVTYPASQEAMWLISFSTNSMSLFLHTHRSNNSHKRPLGLGLSTLALKRKHVSMGTVRLGRRLVVVVQAGSQKGRTITTRVMVRSDPWGSQGEVTTWTIP